MLSGTVTGSGKKTSDFQTMKINGKDVYTYKGKVVLAAWTKELKGTGYNVNNAQNKDTYLFKYFQEVIITIGGVDYDGIILDSCGASGWSTRGNLIDIFVPSAGNSPATECQVKLK